MDLNLNNYNHLNIYTLKYTSFLICDSATGDAKTCLANSFWKNTATTCASCIGGGILTCDGTFGTAVTCVADTYYKDTATTCRDCTL